MKWPETLIAFLPGPSDGNDACSFIRPFVHSFTNSKLLTSAYCVPGTVLGSGGKVGNKQASQKKKFPSLRGLQLKSEKINTIRKRYSMAHGLNCSGEAREKGTRSARDG